MEFNIEPNMQENYSEIYTFWLCLRYLYDCRTSLNVMMQQMYLDKLKTYFNVFCRHIYLWLYKVIT